MIPVFGLGLCAAAACNHTHLLISPMLAHAIYNGVVLGVQMTR